MGFSVKKFVNSATSSPVSSIKQAIKKPSASSIGGALASTGMAVVSPTMSAGVLGSKYLYDQYKKNKEAAGAQAESWEQLTGGEQDAEKAQKKALEALAAYEPMSGFDEAQKKSRATTEGTYANLKNTRAAQGLGGAGSDLSIEQAKQQNLGAGDYQAGMDRAGLEKSSALHKMMTQAGMAGDFRQQEFDEAATKAKGIAAAYGNAANQQMQTTGTILGAVSKGAGAFAGMV